MFPHSSERVKAAGKFYKSSVNLRIHFPILVIPLSLKMIYSKGKRILCYLYGYRESSVNVVRHNIFQKKQVRTRCLIYPLYLHAVKFCSTMQKEQIWLHIYGKIRKYLN